MYPSSTLGESLLTLLTDLVQTLLSYLPQIFIGLLIFGLGLILGKLAKSLIIKAVNSLSLDKFFASTSLSKFFSDAHIEVKIGTILGEICRWLIVYVFLISAVNFVGLAYISEFLTKILTFIPNLLSAAFILAVGIIAAGFIEQFVKSALISFDPSTARLAGKISSYAVVIFALIIAIGELGIAETYINILFIGFVGTLSLCFGLAFGLGAKDLVSKILLEWYHKTKPSSKK